MEILKSEKNCPSVRGKLKSFEARTWILFQKRGTIGGPKRKFCNNKCIFCILEDLLTKQPGRQSSFEGIRAVLVVGADNLLPIDIFLFGVSTPYSRKKRSKGRNDLIVKIASQAPVLCFHLQVLEQDCLQVQRLPMELRKKNCPLES